MKDSNKLNTLVFRLRINAYERDRIDIESGLSSPVRWTGGLCVEHTRSTGRSDYLEHERIPPPKNGIKRISSFYPMR